MSLLTNHKYSCSANNVDKIPGLRDRRHIRALNTETRGLKFDYLLGIPQYSVDKSSADVIVNCHFTKRLKNSQNRCSIGVVVNLESVNAPKLVRLIEQEEVLSPIPEVHGISSVGNYALKFAKK